MSLCRILPIWFYACLGGGALVGWLVLHDTMRGAWMGSAIGVLPILVLGGLGLLLGWVGSEHPKCRCGGRKSEDYDYVPNDLPPVEPMQWDYRCRCCGRLYRHREDVCYEVWRDGKEVPYMRQNRWARWSPVAEG